MPVSKKLYLERKNKNLCTKCGNATEFNKTLCQYHRQRANKNQQAIYAERQDKGLCPVCGNQLANNRKNCNNCLEKSNPNHKRDDVRIPWTDRKKLGLCVACGKPNSTSHQWCKKCSKKYNTTASLTRKQVIANGLCGNCRKRLLAKGSKRCVICIYKNKKWYISSDFRKQKIQKDKLLRNQIMQHYGSKCICCGEIEKTFLAIDHINGGGNKHRKIINKLSARSYYQWIINQNFPDDLQILCYNCNMSKHLLGGTCAHEHRHDGV